jgi:hypothetical protein
MSHVISGAITRQRYSGILSAFCLDPSSRSSVVVTCNGNPIAVENARARLRLSRTVVKLCWAGTKHLAVRKRGGAQWRIPPAVKSIRNSPRTSGPDAASRVPLSRAGQTALNLARRRPVFDFSLLQTRLICMNCAVALRLLPAP